VNAALEQLAGQEHATHLLSSLVEQDKVSHAYLFSGPVSAQKKEAALIFASMIVCENGGCGTCENCTRAKRNSHPDIHFIEPAGAKGYLIEQVRSVVTDASRAPMLAKKKVYIFDSVELMNAASANAFLKTLEEPPASVVLLLLTSHEQLVLPTIVSRCQIVSFAALPRKQAAQNLASSLGVNVNLASIALATCNDSYSQAAQFCESAAQQATRTLLLDTLSHLQELDAWETLVAARKLCDGIDEALEQLKSKQAEELEEAKDFLSASARKSLEESHKRACTAMTNSLFSLRCSIAQTWLRDMLMVCAQCESNIVNADYLPALHAQTNATTKARIVRALDATNRANAAIGYNVNPKLCMDTLLLEIREELYDPDITG
jgi:DNA polymerase III subunit delta'